MKKELRNIRLIACLDKNNGICLNNKLLFNDLKDDMHRFKSLTIYNIVVMGFKTFKSMGYNKLDNRLNIVLTTKKTPAKIFDEEILFVNSMKDLYEMLEELNCIYPEKKIFIIGGESLFYEFIDVAEKLHITHAYENRNADTYFPKIVEQMWKIEKSEEIWNKENGPEYRITHRFVDYKRI